MRLTAWGENINKEMSKGFYYECTARVRNIFSFNGQMKVAFMWCQPIIKCIPYETFDKFKDKYNTMEITSTDDSENLSMVVMSDKKKKELLDSLSKEILSKRDEFGITNKNHISHGEVESILLDLDKPTGLEYELHAKLNRLLQIEKHLGN
jgi:hypothetical protein